MCVLLVDWLLSGIGSLVYKKDYFVFIIFLLVILKRGRVRWYLLFLKGNVKSVWKIDELILFCFDCRRSVVYRKDVDILVF